MSTNLPGSHGPKGGQDRVEVWPSLHTWEGERERDWLERICLGLCGLWGPPDRVTQVALSPISSFGIVIWEILTQKKPYSGSRRRWSLQMGSWKGLWGAEGSLQQKPVAGLCWGSHLLFRDSHLHPPSFLCLLSHFLILQ